MNGATIFRFLCGLKLEFSEFDWLENRGLSEFELLISVILTQNTNWNNVLKALENVRKAKIQSLETLNELEIEQIAELIKPSGFYNQKAKRLKGFVERLLSEFESLENFKENVSRQWLLSVKGLGFESVDSILNYLCQREILVVDSYTNRLAIALGYEFESYEELREFFQSGIEEGQDTLCECLKNSGFVGFKGKNLLSSKTTNSKSKDSKGKKFALYELYQIFHAQIIAFGKAYFKGKNLNDEGKKLLAKLS
ncbi:endonuclease III domain-containing protein [Campylobacter troglodytis]|uniref:endonuclease III domain-containing protein n=1 Tax=Campylobacter troglodytis TaxID=654363 RepID=UPI001159A530|nr:endonuclease III domain-containing protein [Campylobacter troglodytis]TQR53077.1 nuclease [Campylobacter troglodytis]